MQLRRHDECRMSWSPAKSRWRGGSIGALGGDEKKEHMANAPAVNVLQVAVLSVGNPTHQLFFLGYGAKRSSHRVSGNQGVSSELIRLRGAP